MVDYVCFVELCLNMLLIILYLLIVRRGKWIIHCVYRSPTNTQDLEKTKMIFREVFQVQECVAGGL